LTAINKQKNGIIVFRKKDSQELGLKELHKVRFPGSSRSFLASGTFWIILASGCFWIFRTSEAAKSFLASGCFWIFRTSEAAKSSSVAGSLPA